MCRMISILVGRNGHVYQADGIHSHSELAEHFKINQDKFLAYEFHLDKRELFQDWKMDKVPFEAKASHDQAAQAFFDEAAGTPEKLIAFVHRGNWQVTELLPLLSLKARKTYDKASQEAWKAYDKTCQEAWEAHDKTCQEAEKTYYKACQKAEKTYNKAYQEAEETYDKVNQEAEETYNKAYQEALKAHDKACQEAWIPLFEKAKNRVEAWK